MKSLAFLIATLLVFFSALAQKPSDEELKKIGAFLRFEPSEVNMGKISPDEVTPETGKVEIEVYNDGVQPLILNQVSACCGTRVDEWSNKPIAPGQKSTIKISFRVQPNPHRISRTVTVNSNAMNGGALKVAILGEVAVPTKDNEIRLP
jgi:hypothetical protein